MKTMTKQAEYDSDFDVAETGISKIAIKYFHPSCSMKLFVHVTKGSKHK